MSRFLFDLKHHGITNHDSEDYGTVASAPKPTEDTKYDHWCTSQSCCHYIAGYKTLKNGDISPINKQRMKILKFTSHNKVRSCPDCKSILVIKTVC